MTHFHPHCHTSWGHIFHPFCEELSPEERGYYVKTSVVTAIFTLCIAHFIHGLMDLYYKIKGDFLMKRVSALNPPDEVNFEDELTKIEKQCKKDLFFDPNDDVSTESYGFVMETQGQLLKENLNKMDQGSNALQDQDVITCIDKIFKTHFIRGISILKGLDKCIQERGGSQLTRAIVLTEQLGGYRYKQFFGLLECYKKVRGYYGLHPKQRPYEEQWNKFYFENKKKFYREGTPQFKWRELRNIYCQALYWHIKEEELLKEDARFVKWAVPDLHPCQFVLEVGTAPS